MTNYNSHSGLVAGARNNDFMATTLLNMNPSPNMTPDGTYRTIPREAWKYATEFANLYVQFYKWDSPDISIEDLQAIENIILWRGYCCLVRPLVPIGNTGNYWRVNKWLPYNCTISKWNFRNMQPTQVIVMPYATMSNDDDMPIKTTYDEFLFINSNYNAQALNAPPIMKIFDIAVQMYNIDLAINQLLNRAKMPIITELRDEASKNNFQLIQEGTLNGAMMAYVSKANFTDKGALPFHNLGEFNPFASDIALLFKQKQDLRDYFINDLGVTSDTDDKGTYVAANVQTARMSGTYYRAKSGLLNRERCLDKAKKLGINLSVKMMTEMVDDTFNVNIKNDNKGNSDSATDSSSIGKDEEVYNLEG